MTDKQLDRRSTFGWMTKLTALAAALPLGLRSTSAEAAAGRKKMKATSYDNPNMPRVTSSLSWGINLEGVNDLFILSGHAAIKPDNSKGLFPDDPGAQAKYTLEQLEHTFSQAGYTKNDIVSVNWCVTKDLTPEQEMGIHKAWRDYIADVPVKPAGGSWKKIYALISPEIHVEIEMILAR